MNCRPSDSLYLIELPGLLTGLGLCKQGFWQGLVCWSSSNLSLMEFQVRYLVLFPLFSVIDDLGWFWTRSLHKNSQLIMELLRALFSVLHFSFLTNVSVLLLSMVIAVMVILISIYDTTPEYNLEFQGSIQNLWKGALFMKFYPEIPWNNTEMC